MAAFLLTCCCGIALAAPEEEVASKQSAPPLDAEEDTDQEVSEEELTTREEIKEWISGSLEAGFDGSYSLRDTDLNMDQTLSLDFHPPKLEQLRIRGQVWMHEDLDDEPSDSALRDINDADGHWYRARLLYLYAEVSDLWGDSALRLGRQRVQDGVASPRIDGLHFKQRYRVWDWYAFAGVRASIYENAHEDGTFGGGASWKPFECTKLALDGYFAMEHRDGGGDWNWSFWRGPLNQAYRRNAEEDLKDMMLSFSVWQDLTPNHHLFGRYNLRDHASDDVMASATGYIPKLDVLYELTYRYQFRVGDQVNELSSYYRILGTQEAFHHILTALHRPLVKWLVLGVEAEIHLANNDDEFSGNRDYTRTALILEADPLPWGLSAETALEFWHMHSGENTWVVTGELKKEWDAVEISVGMDYEAYEDRVREYNASPFLINRILVNAVPGFFNGFNPLVKFLDSSVVETREDIYAAIARVKWFITKNQDIDFTLTYEHDDGPDSPYWQTQLRYLIRF